MSDQFSGGGGSSLPTQSGQSGKYLTTDGAAASWGTPAGSGTVTHTGNLTATGVVVGNGSADLKVDTGASTDGVGNVTAVSYATSGANGGIDATEGTGASLTAASGHDILWADSTAHRLKANMNNAGATTVALFTDKLSAFAATSSAELAGVISDETGSGALVFGTSPTLSSPVVGTQSASDNSTKAASTAYVTTGIANAIAAVNPAVAVQEATAAKLPNSPTYNNGAAGIGAFITTATTNTALVVDGQTPALLDRILVKNEADSGGLGAAKNGVYYVSQIHGVALAWILTRALDYDQPSDMNNTGAIPVVSGTVNTSTMWLQTSQVATVGTDAVTYGQFSVSPSNIVQAISPGAGIAHFAGSTQTVTSSAIVNADITNSTIDLAAKVTGVLPSANGGTANAFFTVSGPASSTKTCTFPNASTTIPQTIASGTSAMGTSAISSGACATAVTTSATGTATTDVINWGFNGDPTSTTGYSASANGMLTIISYPSANNVNFKVCNNTSASVTPGAVTLNWLVAR